MSHNVHEYFLWLLKSADTTDMLYRSTQYQKSGKMCSCTCKCMYINATLLLLAYHCSCVEQDESVISNLKYKLKNTEEELQTANKCGKNYSVCNIYSDI